MNVFEFDIWKQVLHNGKFTHTIPRMQLVHAMSKESAREKLSLAKGSTQMVGNTEIKVSNEFVYGVRRTGTVTRQMYYEYSDGRQPIPITPH